LPETWNSVRRTIEVRDAESGRVDEGEARISGRTISLKPVPQRTYKAFWRALLVDTHQCEGTFMFRVGK
jgi:methionine-rich copper-binding protein CopC